jgi:hypothetical protein
MSANPLGDPARLGAGTLVAAGESFDYNDLRAAWHALAAAKPKGGE